MCAHPSNSGKRPLRTPLGPVIAKLCPELLRKACASILPRSVAEDVVEIAIAESVVYLGDGNYLKDGKSEEDVRRLAFTVLDRRTTDWVRASVRCHEVHGPEMASEAVDGSSDGVPALPVLWEDLLSELQRKIARDPVLQAALLQMMRRVEDRNYDPPMQELGRELNQIAVAATGADPIKDPGSLVELYKRTQLELLQLSGLSASDEYPRRGRTRGE